MDITSFSSSFAELTSDTLVLGLTPSDLDLLAKPIRNKREHEFSLTALNEAEDGRFAQHIKHFEFKAKAGTQCVFLSRAFPNLERIVLVGIGELSKNKAARVEQYRVFGAKLASIATTHKTKNPAVVISKTDAQDSSIIAAMIEGAILASYRFRNYKKKEETEHYSLQEISLVGQKAIDKKIAAKAYSDAMATLMARDLVNLPPNDCKPKTLVEKAKEIAKQAKYQLDIFDRAALTKMGAGSLLAVAQGSEEPPFLIRMVKPAKSKKALKVAIIGKGVTFDSGGLSIKPAQSMEEMKSDMAGAAAVLATMQALANDKLDVELRCYVPTVENMINGKATRPGDIVRAMNGTSIEILNTDAEGRLILADAICLATQDNCDVIVDLATLTGACCVALGLEYAGLFANEEKLAEQITAAAANAGEKLWRLPLPPEYRKLIDTPVADIQNSGPRWGGAITAALFIKEFVTKPKTAWAHLDIAGPAYSDSDKDYVRKGGVGYGVRTLVSWLRAL